MLKIQEFPISFETPKELFEAKELLFKKIAELGLHNVEIGGGNGEDDNKED